MQIEQLTKLLLNDDEVAAMYEVCAVALEKNLLKGYPLAFALAIVEICADGYWCVVCGRFLEAEYGVIVHDNVPHPKDMTFDDEDKPQ